MVDAIEDGKIVRVREGYARREGLPILRRDINKGPEEQEEKSIEQSKDDFGSNLYGVDSFRKPLDWKKQQVVSELIDNFNWHITRARRHKDLSRKQFADAIGVSENEIKMLENGILPEEGFSLINRVQKFLRINLRRDGQDFSQPMRKLVDSKLEEKRKNEEALDRDFDLVGGDIEIVEG